MGLTYFADYGEKLRAKFQEAAQKCKVSSSLGAFSCCFSGALAPLTRGDSFIFSLLLVKHEILMIFVAREAFVLQKCNEEELHWNITGGRGCVRALPPGEGASHWIYTAVRSLPGLFLFCCSMSPPYCWAATGKAAQATARLFTPVPKTDVTSAPGQSSPRAGTVPRAVRRPGGWHGQTDADCLTPGVTCGRRIAAGSPGTAGGAEHPRPPA